MANRSSFSHRTIFRKLEKLGEGMESCKGKTWVDYLSSDGLDLAPNEVQSVLHLLDGGEQLRRVIAASNKQPCQIFFSCLRRGKASNC